MESNNRVKWTEYLKQEEEKDKQRKTSEGGGECYSKK